MWGGIFKKTSVTLIFFHHYIFYPLATQVHISLSKVYADILQLRVVLSINLSLNYAAYIFFFSLQCTIFEMLYFRSLCFMSSMHWRFHYHEILLAGSLRVFVDYLVRLRKRKDWDVYGPMVDLLSNEEVDALEAREERNARSMIWQYQLGAYVLITKRIGNPVLRDRQCCCHLLLVSNARSFSCMRMTLAIIMHQWK